jgi:hypothetical protein
MAALMSDLPPPTREEINSFRERTYASERMESWHYANKGKKTPESLENTLVNYMHKSAPFIKIQEERKKRLYEIVNLVKADYLNIFGTDEFEHALQYYYNSLYMDGGGKRNTDKSRRKTRRR